jgi:mannose-6-phosphate isomerase-like protein (cupin superfamily)
MFHVGKLDESRFALPQGYEPHARGYRRASLIDHVTGSVHMAAAICELAPHGDVAWRVQANEKGIYVLAGALEVKRGHEVIRLSADDYALIPHGMAHALRTAGSKAVRWFEMQAPQPKPPGGWQDTFFVDEPTALARAPKPAAENSPPGSVGHYAPVNPMVVQVEGTHGLAAYRFMDRPFGAQHFYMMRGELAVGGRRSYHDHPIEEFYFALSGESFMDIEGQRFHLRPGDVAWTGVGASHAFCHTGEVPFRWIETQAPQFPAENGTRNYVEWDKLRTVNREP